MIVTIARLVDANKAKAAFLAPLILALGTAAANWIGSGEFDTTEILAAAGGAVLAGTAAVATWLTPAKVAEIDPGQILPLAPEGDAPQPPLGLSRG